VARLHALELSPDATGAAAVVAAWQQLADAGLPSQLLHQGMTNAPHVTVVATPDPVSADVVEHAVRLLAPMLPVTVALSGLIVFGGPRPGLAWALEVPDELVAAVLELRATTVGHRHRGWLPHVTLARRLKRADVGAAWAALEPGPRELVLTTVRHWDPERELVRTVHDVGPA
jgi:2'-5' RNA ligase